MKQESNYIVFNIPTSIKLNLIFPSFKKDLDKVAFLISQINHFTSTGGYTVNVRNHDWLFGHKGLTSKIIKTLVSENIIAPIGYYVVGSASTKFKMVNPFTVKKENDNKNIYDSFYFNKNEIDFPKFIQKWLADDYSVKNASTTAFVDVKRSKQQSSTDDVTLLSEIKELKKALKEANLTIDKLTKELAEAEIISSTNEVLTGSTINALVEIINDRPTGTNSAVIVSKSQAPEFIATELEVYFGDPIKATDRLILYQDFQLQVIDENLVLESAIKDFDGLKRLIEKTLT